jgi:hypothetical protein
MRNESPLRRMIAGARPVGKYGVTSPSPERPIYGEGLREPRASEDIG